MKDEIAMFNPFSDGGDEEVQKAELKTIDYDRLAIMRDIKTEKQKLIVKYPLLNTNNFFKQIKEKSLLIEENNDELENLIISYLCPACGPEPRNMALPMQDRTNYKTSNK